MAFTSNVSLGTANSTAASTTLALTTTSIAEVGKLVVLIIAADNTSTVNTGSGNEITTISDTAGNAYVKLREFVNSQGAAAAGVTVSLWIARITTELASASTITITLGASRVSKCVSAHKFSVDSGFTYENMGGADLENDAADLGAISLAGLPNREYLYIRASAQETNATTQTETLGYTLFTAATASTGVVATSVATSGSEFKIVTSGNQTSDSTASPVDSASVFVALREVPIIEGKIVLPVPFITATSIAQEIGTSSFNLPKFSSVASTGKTGGTPGDADFDLPKFSLQAGGNPPYEIGKIKVSATGVSGTASKINPHELPALTFIVKGLNGTVANANNTLPKLKAVAFDGNDVIAKLPALKLVATGLNGTTATASANLSGLIVKATGLVENLAKLNKSLPALKLVASGKGTETAALKSTLKSLSVSGKGVVGTVGVCALLLPKLKLVATGIAPSVGAARIELPSLVVSAEQSLSAFGTFVTALALNVQNNALTTYDNYNFNSMTVFNGQSIAASGDGIYLLEGKLDNGASIAFKVKMANSDFGSAQQKRLQDMIFGYQSNANVDVIITADNTIQFNYVLENTGNVGLYNNRLKLGKGMKARYYQVELSGRTSLFEMDGLSVEPVILERKVA